MMDINKFEDFQMEKNDEITNAAYNLIVSMLRGGSEAADEDIQPWDMSIIGDMIDAAEGVLKAHGKEPCDPFYGDDEEPCPNVDDCQRTDCPFRQGA